MKLFVKLLLLLVVTAVAAPFMLKGPDGRPLMRLNGLAAPAVRLPDFAGAAAAMRSRISATPAQPLAVYKWQDENGRWHFSDLQEQGHPARQMTVNPDANVVHLAAQQRPAGAVQGAGGSALSASGPAMGALSTLLGAAKDAGRLQAQRDARQAQIMHE